MSCRRRRSRRYLVLVGEQRGARSILAGPHTSPVGSRREAPRGPSSAWLPAGAAASSPGVAAPHSPLRSWRRGANGR